MNTTKGEVKMSKPTSINIDDVDMPASAEIFAIPVVDDWGL